MPLRVLKKRGTLPIVRMNKVINKNNEYTLHARKFYIRNSNNKVDSIETGRIVIVHLLP